MDDYYFDDLVTDRCPKLPLMTTAKLPATRRTSTNSDDSAAPSTLFFQMLMINVRCKFVFFSLLHSFRSPQTLRLNQSFDNEGEGGSETANKVIQSVLYFCQTTKCFPLSMALRAVFTFSKHPVARFPCPLCSREAVLFPL